MNKKAHQVDDPRTQGPQPPFPQQPQQPPGIESMMEPRPDYGEESYRGSNRLKGKAAIITGGDSGIGRAVALAYAREGADVLISYLHEESDARETCQVVEQAGVKAVSVGGDIGTPDHCNHIVDEALTAFGRLDILVNNAAYQMNHPSFAEIAPNEIEYTFRTNIFAMFYLCQAAMTHLQPGSAIINTASIQAYQPSAQLLPYATTKGAIITFTKGLAEEAIKQGVRVNAVAPGPVWTPLITSTTPPEYAAEFGKQTPVGRPAQPAELAPLYVFLASAEASYIIGEVIGVTGGKPLA
ncbi:MAG: SDR family oxidoreductase [Oscillochloris sp.]|nr:SDR family oxidoreductase [Oscillochloris sp.]